MTQSERFKGILDHFKRHQPDAATELSYNSPYELLVAVILSAQCTDKRVNLTTPAFFEKYPDAESLSKAAVDDIFPLIKSISYPNNKSKHLSGMAKMLVNEFDGEVPADVKLLQRLPGVGRKTANVIASCIFNQPKMAVDTHVFRVAARIGLTIRARNPMQAELQLIRHIPEHQVSLAHHWLILHGRYICLARKPRCAVCAVSSFCRYYEVNHRKEKRDAS